MVEQCYIKRKTTINPIVDWTDDDVWEFIKEVAKVPYCELYDQGFTRLGCIGCPLQGREGMIRDFERWPGYRKLYIRAFEQMIKNHPGKIKVASGELAESNEGGTAYTPDGSCGTPDGDPDRRSQDTDEFNSNWGGRWPDGAADGQRTDWNGSNYGWRLWEGEQPRSTETMVVECDGGGKLNLLDKQLLIGEAILRWWMWMQRKQTEKEEPNPIRR